MKGRGKGKKLVVSKDKKYPRYFKKNKKKELPSLLDKITDKKILDKIKE